MKTQTTDLVRRFRRAGPPALLAACLAVGPAYAQSTTVTTTGDPSVETTKTKVKEKANGDVVVKEKKTTSDGDVTVKQRTTVDEPSTTTTTTVR